MTRKADFNADEWSELTAAPVLAAIAVAAADRGGTLREGLAVAQLYKQTRAASHSELMEALLASPPSVQPVAPAERDELPARAEAALLKASDLLRERGSDAEVLEFGDFVVAACDAVARAHKEGGALGFGGKEISAPEQAVLDRILGALGPRPGG
jgi:hypothetical protein